MTGKRREETCLGLVMTGKREEGGSQNPLYSSNGRRRGGETEKHACVKDGK